MANVSDIRFHIKSVKQTRQITNAMHMVSAARMRRALDGIQKNRAYFYHALDIIVDIQNHTGDITHRYLKHRAGDKVAYIVVAGEKGLSGSYNHAVLALADSQAKIAQALDHLVDRYGRRTQRGWEVTLEINRQDLANMAGTTRETVSRVFRTLKDEGVIEDEERRLVVLDRERLRAFFEES